MEVSIDEPLNVDWDGTEEDCVYKNMEDEANCQMLKAAMRNLSAREKVIIDLRFGLNSLDGKEKTQKEVADMLGISQSYISRLEKKIMKRLKTEILKFG